SKPHHAYADRREEATPQACGTPPTPPPNASQARSALCVRVALQRLANTTRCIGFLANKNNKRQALLGVCTERETGFEPATSTLASLHSTTELLPHGERIMIYSVKIRRAGDGIRTRDINLGKVALYH